MHLAAGPPWKDAVMRLSSCVVAPSFVAVLATMLFCSPAVAQPTKSSTLPDITVDAPKQAVRPYRPQHAAGAVTSRRERPVAQAASQATQSPSAAPGSVEARFARLERAATGCNGGCETSFKSGNAPWVGCSLSGQEFSHFDTTCSDTLRYKHYADCAETKAFLGWDRNKVWLHCSSLLAGGKFQVAELKRARRAR
ncbi:hypothetical protein ACQR05_02885 [Bradyrhizobium oligotrophicum]|uniref:hypothetical protein n=1 Tax=Bradyrhizobium oligotrophicum TaxID=44255 RepID=UPI003EBFE92A